MTGFAGSRSPSDMEFEGGELEGAPERGRRGFVGFSVPHRDQEAAEFVGAADGRHDEEFLAEVIAELFPRVAPYAFPPANFAFVRERDRVTEGEIHILLDAASKKRSAPGPIESSANLSR